MLSDYERNVNEWLSEMNWKENPFTLKIFPSLFTGYEEDVKNLIYHVKEGHKFALVLGATGSGKTTFLRFLKKELSSRRKVVYLSKPPKTNEIVDIFLNIFRPSFFRRLFGINISLHELSGYLNKKMNQSQSLLLLIDEGHEASLETLEWLRTLTDQVENLQLIIAGLNSLEDYLNDNLETLLSRVTTKIELSTLTIDEVKDLIRKRIEKMGGNDIKPFNEKIIEEIYEKTGGFPREVLKICDKLVTHSIKEKRFEIDDLSHVKEKRKDKERISRDFLKDLPYKQRKIVKILSQEDKLLPSEIADIMGFDNYKSKQHAVRSVNNILRRLMEGGYVSREKRGKGYLYSLSMKIKSFMVES